MTRKEIKLAVRQFQKKFDCRNLTCDLLRDAAEALGYTVVEFSHIANDPEVQTLIRALRLSDAALRCKGFTFANQDYRLLFVHDDLSEAEEQIVLAHELGHICLEHMESTKGTVMGKDVQEEFEANEFAHYLLNPSTVDRLRQTLGDHKKAIAISAAALIVAAAVAVGLVFALAPAKEFGEYYVTATGVKYHTADCGYVRGKDNTRLLTEAEFDAGTYQPCGKCLP